MSGKYATPLSLEPGRSRQLGVFIATVHAAAMPMLPFTGLPLPVTIAIALAVAGSFLRAWRTHVSLTGQAAIRRLRWSNTNDWQLIRQGGTTVHTSLQPRVFIHPRLVILRFRQSPWRSDSVLLTADRLDPEIFRKLRVRLLTEIGRLAGSTST